MNRCLKIESFHQMENFPTNCLIFMKTSFIHNELGTNVDFESVLKRQNDQYELLKEQLNLKKKEYQDYYRKVHFEEMEWQRQLESLRKQRQDLEQKLKTLIQKQNSQNQEKIAREMIENIWNILQDFRQRIHNKTPPSEYCFQQKPSILMSEIYEETEMEKENCSNTCFEDINDYVQSDIKLNAPSASQPVTPDFDIKKPVIDSIASRRTPRAKCQAVYYKEPNLREKIDPNGPYAFTLTQRETPTRNRIIKSKSLK